MLDRAFLNGVVHRERLTGHQHGAVDVFGRLPNVLHAVRGEGKVLVVRGDNLLDADVLDLGRGAVWKDRPECRVDNSLVTGLGEHAGNSVGQFRWLNSVTDGRRNQHWLVLLDRERGVAARLFNLGEFAGDHLVQFEAVDDGLESRTVWRKTQHTFHVVRSCGRALLSLGLDGDGLSQRRSRDVFEDFLGFGSSNGGLHHDNG